MILLISVFAVTCHAQDTLTLQSGKQVTGYINKNYYGKIDFTVKPGYNEYLVYKDSIKAFTIVTENSVQVNDWKKLDLYFPATRDNPVNLKQKKGSILLITGSALTAIGTGMLLTGIFYSPEVAIAGVGVSTVGIGINIAGFVSLLKAADYEPPRDFPY